MITQTNTHARAQIRAFRSATKPTTSHHCGMQIRLWYTLATLHNRFLSHDTTPLPLWCTHGFSSLHACIQPAQARTQGHRLFINPSVFKPGWQSQRWQCRGQPAHRPVCADGANDLTKQHDLQRQRKNEAETGSQGLRSRASGHGSTANLEIPRTGLPRRMPRHEPLTTTETSYS